MPLISLLIVLIVVCVLFWAVQQILRAFGIGDPIRTIVMVVFVLIAVVWVLSVVGLVPGGTIRLH